MSKYQVRAIGYLHREEGFTTVNGVNSYSFNEVGDLVIIFDKPDGGGCCGIVVKHDDWSDILLYQVEQ